MPLFDFRGVADNVDPFLAFFRGGGTEVVVAGFGEDAEDVGVLGGLEGGDGGDIREVDLPVNFVFGGVFVAGETVGAEDEVAAFPALVSVREPISTFPLPLSSPPPTPSRVAEAVEDGERRGGDDGREVTGRANLGFPIPLLQPSTLQHLILYKCAVFINIRIQLQPRISVQRDGGSVDGGGADEGLHCRHVSSFNPPILNTLFRLRFLFSSPLRVK